MTTAREKDKDGKREGAKKDDMGKKLLANMQSWAGRDDEWDKRHDYHVAPTNPNYLRQKLPKLNPDGSRVQAKPEAEDDEDSGEGDDKE